MVKYTLMACEQGSYVRLAPRLAFLLVVCDVLQSVDGGCAHRGQ